MHLPMRVLAIVLVCVVAFLIFVILMGGWGFRIDEAMKSVFNFTDLIFPKESTPLP